MGSWVPGSNRCTLLLAGGNLPASWLLRVPGEWTFHPSHQEAFPISHWCAQKRIPESLYPGRFDIWGHSHTIWHIFVVLSILAHMGGLLHARNYSLEHAACRIGLWNRSPHVQLWYWHGRSLLKDWPYVHINPKVAINKLSDSTYPQALQVTFKIVDFLSWSW